MKLDKITRLQALLDLPDKYDNDEEIKRKTIKSEEDLSENLSIFDYLEL